MRAASGFHGPNGPISPLNNRRGRGRQLDHHQYSHCRRRPTIEVGCGCATVAAVAAAVNLSRLVHLACQGRILGGIRRGVRGTAVPVVWRRCTPDSTQQLPSFCRPLGHSCRHDITSQLDVQLQRLLRRPAATHMGAVRPMRKPCAAAGSACDIAAGRREDAQFGRACSGGRKWGGWCRS